MASNFIFGAGHKFFETVGELNNHYPEEVERYTHLEDYLNHWLKLGNAVEETGGNFGTYMQVVVYIIDDWLQDATMGVIPSDRPPLQGVIKDPESPDVPYFMHPDVYGSIALKKMMSTS